MRRLSEASQAAATSGDGAMEALLSPLSERTAIDPDSCIWLRGPGWAVSLGFRQPRGLQACANTMQLQGEHWAPAFVMLVVRCRDGSQPKPAWRDVGRRLLTLVDSVIEDLLEVLLVAFSSNLREDEHLEE